MNKAKQMKTEDLEKEREVHQQVYDALYQVEQSKLTNFSLFVGKVATMILDITIELNKRRK